MYYVFIQPKNKDTMSICHVEYSWFEFNISQLLHRLS